jgi:hypothetical protein
MNAPHDRHASPPPGWECETPKYRATRDIEPAEKTRFRFEPPFAKMASSDRWQYGHKSVERGEVIETKFWPHPSFQPINYSAARVLEFFNARQKSRLPWQPWRRDRVVLDDGLTGPTQPNISINSEE